MDGEPGRLQSMGSLRVGHDWVTSLSLLTFLHWRRKWQPTPVFLPGESQGQEPGGLPSMGSHRVGHDWRDLAAAERLAYCQLSRASFTHIEAKFLDFMPLEWPKRIKDLRLLEKKWEPVNQFWPWEGEAEKETRKSSAKDSHSTVGQPRC